MKVLILSSDGMLGHKVFSHIYKNNKYEVKGTIKDKNDNNTPFIENFLDNIIDNIDVNNFQIVEDLACRFNPDVIINCIGLIKQLKISRRL